jgi:hypothetical protein
VNWDQFGHLRFEHFVRLWNVAFTKPDLYLTLLAFEYGALLVCML